MVFDYRLIKKLNFYLSSPIGRYLILRLSEKEVGTSTLERALTLYSGFKSDLTFKQKLQAIPILMLLEAGRIAFNVERKAMKDYFADPVKRRGLSIVVKSICEYGVSPPQKLSAPFLVVWNYTNACNLRCKHCYQNAKKPLANELSTEERLDIVDQLNDLGTVALAFSGGEPLMRSDFWEVARYAAEKGMYVSLATNGTMLTSETCARLVEIGVRYVEVSIDGAKPATHDRFRGVKGAWLQAVKGILNACEHSELFLCVASTITKHNFQELEALIKLAKELGARRFIAFNYIPTGRGKYSKELDPDPWMREEMLKILYRHMIANLSSGFDVLTTAPQYSRVCLEQRKGPFAVAHFGTGMLTEKMQILADLIGGCGAGRTYCAIQPDGAVTPCVFIPVTAGNLREQSFSEIWHKSKVLESLRTREDLEDSCGSCGNKYICGGCRARAYAYCGSLKAPDVGCIKNMEKYLECISNGCQVEKWQS